MWVLLSHVRYDSEGDVSLTHVPGEEIRVCLEINRDWQEAGFDQRNHSPWPYRNLQVERECGDDW